MLTYNIQEIHIITTLPTHLSPEKPFTWNQMSTGDKIAKHSTFFRLFLEDLSNNNQTPGEDRGEKPE